MGTTLTWILVAVLGLPVGVTLLIGAAFLAGMLGLASATLTPSGRAPSVDLSDASTHIDPEWPERQGFEFVGAFTLVAAANPKGRIFAWGVPGAATFFCLYVFQTPKEATAATDMVTFFEGDVGLTTASSADGMLVPPRPGEFKQAITSGIDEQWRAHLEAEQYVRSSLRIDYAALDVPFDELFLTKVRSEARVVQRRSWFGLRAAYWYFTRTSRADRTIEQQYPDLNRTNLS